MTDPVEEYTFLVLRCAVRSDCFLGRYKNLRFQYTSLEQRQTNERKYLLVIKFRNLRMWIDGCL